MKNLFFAFLVLCTLLGLISGASAVVERTITDEEYDRRSTWVALAEVVEIQSFWRDNRILSRVKLTAKVLYRGSSSTVALLVPGGTVGHLSQVVPGGPKFAVGALSLYALEPIEDSGDHRLVGFSQGKLDDRLKIQTRIEAWQKRGWLQPGRTFNGYAPSGLESQR